MEFEFSLGESGIGGEIESPEEITLELLSDGIYECMYHEFLFEDEAKEALQRCGYIKGQSEEFPTPQKLTLVLQEMLSPMKADCTIDGKTYEIKEEIRAALEKQYIEFAVDWILAWEV